MARSAGGGGQLYLGWVQKKWSLEGRGGRGHSGTGDGVLKLCGCVCVCVRACTRSLCEVLVGGGRRLPSKGLEVGTFGSNRKQTVRSMEYGGEKRCESVGVSPPSGEAGFK